MTSGSTAGEPTVLVGPELPVAATTVTPAATAASFAIATGSSPIVGYALLPKYGLPPKDSLITSTPATVTAYSTACTSSELNATLLEPNTLRPTSEAPGATPRTLMVQPAGSGWAELTKVDRSYTWRPWEATVLAMPNASRPPPRRSGS